MHPFDRLRAAMAARADADAIDAAVTIALALGILGGLALSGLL